MSVNECEFDDEKSGSPQCSIVEVPETPKTVPLQLTNGKSESRNHESSIGKFNAVTSGGEGGAKTPVESRGSHDWGKRQDLRKADPLYDQVVNNDHTLDGTSKCHQSIGCTKPMRPSKLNPNYSGQGGDLSRTPGYRNKSRGYAQYPPHGLPAHEALNVHHEKGWLPKFNNMMHLGYHKESNERTKLLPDTSVWQWPSSPIGQYNLPLSAPPIAKTHSIVQSPLSNNAPSLPVYDFPNYLPPTAFSNSPISPVSAPQGDRLQHFGAQVDFKGTPRRAASTITASAKSIADIDHHNHAKFIKNRSMTRPLSGKKRARDMSVSQSNAKANGKQSAVDEMALNQEDQQRVQTLITAMNDMSSSEDNEGMIKSWDKMRLSKAARINTVCEELLLMTKRAAALRGGSLCDRKRSSNRYATFVARFDAICITLRTQKTVCKHLMEDPYLYQVVDDPIYASSRVANNRRVNKGKKVAIEQGRKILGLKGNGKGRPLVKSEEQEDGGEQRLDETHSEDGDYSTDTDGSEDDSFRENGLNYVAPLTTPTLRDRSSLKKPTYVSHDSDGVLEFVEEDHEYPVKKAKRQIRSKGQKVVSNDHEAVSRYQTEDIDNVKPELEASYPVTRLLEFHPTSTPPAEPSPVQPTGDSYSFQGNFNTTGLPYDHFGYNNGYGGFAPVSLQNITPSMYSSMQPPTPQQQQFPLHINTMGYDEDGSYFESASNTEHYSSDPITDETDVPSEFTSAWYHSHPEQQA